MDYMKHDEKTIFEHRLKMLGVTSLDNYFADMPNFKNCKDLIFETSWEKYKAETSKTTTRKLKELVMKKSQFIFNSVNLDVRYMDINLYLFIHCFYNEKIINKSIDKKLKMVNIFKVPVTITKEEGYIKFLENESGNIISKIIVCRDLPESAYIHELGHGLLVRNKGIINNYFHQEFVPIVLEILYMYHNYKDEGLYVALLCRLNDLQEIIGMSLSDINTKIRDGYIVSGLLAFYYVEKYIESSVEEKNKMLNQLKMVLNGELVLEKLFENYEISFENDEVLKSLEKKKSKFEI